MICRPAGEGGGGGARRCQAWSVPGSKKGVPGGDALLEQRWFAETLPEVPESAGRLMSQEIHGLGGPGFLEPGHSGATFVRLRGV